MKNKFIFLMAMFLFLLILGATQVYADVIVDDNDPYFNPTVVLPAGDAYVTDWLSGLTGETVYQYYKEEDYFKLHIEEYINPYYEYDPGIPNEEYDWIYAVIKFGTLSIAFEDTNLNNILDDLGENDYLGLILLDGFKSVADYNLADGGDGQMWQSESAISNIAFYGTTAPNPVPEPATMLLLGSGLVGLGAFGRKRFRK